MRTFRFIRLWIIPLLSLIATFFLPLSNHFLWLLWCVAFISVCDGGPSTMGVIRPALWVGLHVVPIVSQLIR